MRIRLPGASPDEMTSQVILPVEEQLSSVSGLDELEIMVMDGSARITCRFVLDRKMEDAAQDVREKMALAMGKLPPNVELAVITKADPESDPIITLVVGGLLAARSPKSRISRSNAHCKPWTASRRSTSSAAETVRFRSCSTPKAQQPSHHRQSGRPRAGKRKYRSARRQALSGTEELAVRTMGRFDAAREFSDLIVSSAAGAPIKVSDLGRVEDTYKEPRSFARLDGKPAVRCKSGGRRGLTR